AGLCPHMQNHQLGWWIFISDYLDCFLIFKKRQIAIIIVIIRTFSSTIEEILNIFSKLGLPGSTYSPTII
ncbi:MAG: hypothetical protein LUG46_08790, partial [Erysipelotrichaceae bacterium]|nr:hypothetical protein [Erysipelotrichaceae bacterium]